MMIIQQEIDQIISTITNIIGTDLSREKNKGIPQQINFVEQLEEDDGAAMFFISEKQQKNYSQLFFRFINCNKMI